MVKPVVLMWLLPALVLAAVPSITRPVTDPQGMLTAQETEVVSKALVDLRAAKHVQMAVLLVDTTNGEPIEDYAQAVFRQWKGGDAGRDNGLLLVIARADRRSRLEVGYGLEAALTDGEAKGLLHAQGPLLREGRFEPALLAIIAGVDAQVPAGEFPGASTLRGSWTPSQTSRFLVALFVTACVMARLLLHRGRMMGMLLVAVPLLVLLAIGTPGPRSPLFIFVAYGVLTVVFFRAWRMFQKQAQAAWGLLLLLMPMAALAYSQLWSHDPILELGDFFLWGMGSVLAVPVLLPFSLLVVAVFREMWWPSEPRSSWSVAAQGGHSSSSDSSVSTSAASSDSSPSIFGFLFSFSSNDSSSSSYDSSSSSFGSSSSSYDSSSSSYDSSSSFSSDSSSSSSDWSGGGGDSGGGGSSDSW